MAHEFLLHLQHRDFIIGRLLLCCELFYGSVPLCAALAISFQQIIRNTANLESVTSASRIAARLDFVIPGCALPAPARYGTLKRSMWCQNCGRVITPSAVSEELMRSRAPVKVQEWMKQSPDWLEVLSPTVVVDAKLAKLDEGERDAIALAEAAEMGSTKPSKRI
jgi:hypothetical protein